MTSAHNHRTLAFLLSIVSLAFISCGHGARKETLETEPGVNDRIQTRIGGMAMSEPHEALALIDSAEKAGVLSSFQAQRRRAMIYFNPLQEDLKVIECAKDALETAPGKVSDQERIQLLRLMSNSYYFLGEYDSCIERAREGEQIAVSIDSLAAEGEFKFIIGECMLRLGQIAKGYANMEYGLAALSRVDGYSARTTLSHLFGEEMNFMIIDSKFDDAIKTGQRREAILEELRSEHGTDDYLDQQFGYLYGKMAYLHAETGDMAKAEDYAGKFLETKYSKDNNGRLRIMEYYLASNQPQKALELFSGTDFPSPGDTLSSDGGYYLRLKARACNALGDYKNAYSLLDRAYAISDSLDRKMDNENALKASAVNRAHEVELEAKEAETKEARYMLLLILIIALCIILAAAFLYYYHNTRNLVEKSRLITMGRSDTKEYIKLLQNAQARIHELTPKGDAGARASETDSWQLFLKLEDAMEKQQLYLNKSITRADILEVLGIGKNRLAQMFQDMGGDLSLPTYINGKRLNHALEVISEHPEYTVNEIAEASGFSNTRNFHLLFKKRFGITPLQYRNGK